MKEFLKSPKKTAILGLVGSVIMLLIVLMTFSSQLLITNTVYNLFIIGLVFYFTVVLMRMRRQKGNIKIANYTLIITYTITLIGTISFGIAEGESILIEVLIYGIIILYLCNILLRKFRFINNKIYAVVIIGLSIYQIVSVGRYLFIYNDVALYVIRDLIRILSYMATVPYFYNYYELLKEENRNGK